jgi:hypothetical protein
MWRVLRLDCFSLVVRQIIAMPGTRFSGCSEVAFVETPEIPPVCGYRRNSWRLDAFAVGAADYFIPRVRNNLPQNF